MTVIEVIELRTILDSRGNPTVEADVYTSSGHGRSAAPSGASTGSLEAKVRAPREAVDNAIQNVIPALVGMDTCDQESFDEQLRDIDGTANFAEIGANVARDCNRWGMPLLIMSYPRGKGIDSFSAQSIGHAVRVAEELGADLIKTNYPNDSEAFGKIVKACSVPVFIAGGEKCADLESLKIIRDSVNAGGAGVCVGRNAFQRKDTKAFVQALCNVVHHNVDPAKALEQRK